MPNEGGGRDVRWEPVIATDHILACRKGRALVRS
jgi:hypothetical protein